jgi:S-adenosylmethionine hydrolase
VLVHLVADFGANDLAFAEVTQALVTHLPTAMVVSTSVDPFDTLAAGFVAAQLAAAPAPDGALMLLNVAPRRDDTGPRVDNDGERLLVAEMTSGFRVLGVEAGYSFSFLAEAAERIWAVDWPTRGSQFRSRDLFPEALARLAAGELEPSQRLGAIPPVPDSCIAYVDGFGNLKTTIRWNEELARHAGAGVEVEVGGVRHPARVVGGSFAVSHGELAVAPGSSGYQRRHGEHAAGDDRVRWVELFLRGGSAAKALKVDSGRPGAGDSAGFGAVGPSGPVGAPVVLHLPDL